MRQLLCCLIALMFIFALPVCAMAEVSFLPSMTGLMLEQMPIELTVSADVTAYAPFDDERLPQLTNLLKHLSLRLSWQPLMDEVQSSVSVLVDDQEMLTLGLQKMADSTMAQFSALPDVSYLDDDPLETLLGVSAEPTVLGVNGSEYAWLQEGYELLNATESALLPFLDDEADVKLNISDMGTARVRQDYTVSADDAPDLASLLCGVCPDGQLKELLARLVFSGKQTLRVYRLENGVPLRMEWNGQCGLSEETLRKVKLVWKLRRDDTAYRDELTLTSPAVKGSDQNKLDWSCLIQPKKNGQITLTGKLTYAVTKEKQKTTLTGSCKLTSTPSDAGNQVTGELTLKRELPGEDSASSLVFTPNLLVSGDANLPSIAGDVTVTAKLGTKVTDEAILHLALQRTTYTAWQMRMQTMDLSLMDEASIELARQELTHAIASQGLRCLLQLPRGDLDYLFRDLPEETVSQILNAVP